MNNSDKIVKHLEMIQTVINRLGNNSFLLKGWSLTILTAVILFVFSKRIDVNNDVLPYVLFPPIIFFWILDGYFLWQERLFRSVYDDVRNKEDTDFAMNIGEHNDGWFNIKSKKSWIRAIFSITVVSFYVMQVLVAVVIVVFA